MGGWIRLMRRTLAVRVLESPEVLEVEVLEEEEIPEVPAGVTRLRA